MIIMLCGYRLLSWAISPGILFSHIEPLYMMLFHHEKEMMHDHHKSCHNELMIMDYLLTSGWTLTYFDFTLRS